MTLIVGVKLPKGVLIISDTRETDLQQNVITEYKRKIVRIAPCTYLAAAGSESTFYTARILRNSLYNNGTIETINRSILDIFVHVNRVYESINYHPVGPVMVGQYNKANAEYKLFTIDPQLGNNYDTLTEIHQIATIGANPVIRATIEQKIKLVLSQLSQHMEHPNIHEIVTKNIHNFYKELSMPTIGKNILVGYLTDTDGIPTSANFFINQIDELFNINAQQDSEEISIQKIP